MKILKSVLRLLSLLCLAVLAMTGEVLSAVLLLMFSSISLGILIGERKGV